MACKPSSSIEPEPELRLMGSQFSLGLTHNSHLGRSFSSPNSAYSATITFEFFLTEQTDYSLIPQFAVVDNDNKGWVFDSETIQQYYNSNNNSLIFADLELRIFDNIRNKLVNAKFLDENGELIRERGFFLDNNFPLPVTTTLTSSDSTGFTVLFDFYNTPYDGGNLPFAVTIYNTYYSSNSFTISWLNEEGVVINENYLDKNSLTEVETNTWTLFLSSESIPEGAVKFYTTFRRGGYTRGGVLYTQILDVP